MNNMKITCTLLLLVGACNALPQYSDQGDVGGGLQQQQSQCASNQGCVPFYQCVDGYINTDGAGILGLRSKPKGTCTEPDYPGVPAICCNIPGVPEPPPQCPSNQGCVPWTLCVNGYIVTDGAGVLGLRSGTPSGTCTDPDFPDVITICCNLPGAPKPAPSTLASLTTCPEGNVCVRNGQCVGNGNVDTDGSGLFDVRSGHLKQCYVGQTPEVGSCCSPPPAQSVFLEYCPHQSECMQEHLCQGLIIDNIGALVPYIAGGSWSECAHGGYSNNGVGVCCLNPAPPTPVYPVAGQCGVRNTDPVPNQRIQSPIADNEAMFGEFPWQARILFGNDTFKCGASLIDNRLIVTAAHCVNGFNPDDFKVRFGEWQLNTFDEPKPYVDVDVAVVTIHPQFNPRNVQNDIAVMQLVEPIDLQYHINSICLPSPGQTFWGQRCIATGWGKDTFNGQFQQIMKKVELPMVEHNQCQNLLRKTRLGKFFKLDDSFICAGGEENSDACKGDGGGPLACQDPATGQYFLAGITAFGIGCGAKDVPGVYADVQALLPFVQPFQTADVGTVPVYLNK